MNEPVIVACSASDVKFPWTESADQLKQHVDSRPYEQLRHVFEDLMINHVRLTERCEQLETTINQYETSIKYRYLDRRMNEMLHRSSLSSNQISHFPHRRSYFYHKYDYLCCISFFLPVLLQFLTLLFSLLFLVEFFIFVFSIPMILLFLFMLLFFFSFSCCFSRHCCSFSSCSCCF